MTDSRRPPQPLTSSELISRVALFEVGLLLVAFALGYLVDVSPTAELQWSLTDFGLGLAATVPMLLLLSASWLSGQQSIVRIREFLREVLGPLLSQCRLHDILFLAFLTGVCEEVLFRGLLYQFIKPWNPMLAITITNILFGLAHAVTPLYAWIAGLIGLYLTALMAIDPSPNLLIPITAHAAYDFIGFLLVAWDYRRWKRLKASGDSSEESDEPAA